MSRVHNRHCPECNSVAWSYIRDIGNCYRCEANFIVGFTRNFAMRDSHLHYTEVLARECLQTGIEMAWKAKKELSVDRMYVFDAVDYFDCNSNLITVGGIRYKTKIPMVLGIMQIPSFAVLSSAAQKTFRHVANSVDDYLKIAHMTALTTDDIGVYIEHQEPERKQDLTR